jgi:Arm DNA-binding domain
MLTAKRIESLRTKPGRYGDGLGLYLCVVSKENASWVYRYQRGGKDRMLGLGPLHTVSLKNARERAREARLKLLDGIDPVAEKKAKKSAAALEVSRHITFEAATGQYF